MSSVSKVLFEKHALMSQSVESVVELLKFLGRAADPLPEAVQLPGLILVLSNRRDIYYSVSSKGCSCPARVYGPGKACKHMRKHFPETVKPRSIADALGPVDSIRPTGKWAGYNGPVSDLMGETKEQCKAGR